ncbi:MAG: hypothetical protein KDD94_05620, partial [Calditrichaeota bacterium]|nr:hypothetical protein [Calditrichota bacterium]
DSYLDDLRESACDLEVITRKGSSKDYAQTLYHINEMVQQKVGGLATVPFIRKTSQLKRRILRMRNVQKNDGKISRLIVTGLITASTIFIACSDTTGLEEKEIDNAQFSNVKLQKIEKAQAEKKQMAEKSKNVFFGSEIELEKKLTEEQKKLFQKQLDKEFELADDKDKSGNLHFSEEREFKIRQLKEKEISGNVKLRPKKELFEIRPDGFTKEEQNKIRQFKTEGDTKQLKEYIEKRAATKTLHDKRNTVKLRELKEKPKTDN